MRMRGLQQQWWRVDPAVNKESAPQLWLGSHQQHSLTHMDRPSGLYSDSEQSQWATLQAVPVYWHAHLSLEDVENGIRNRLGTGVRDRLGGEKVAVAINRRHYTFFFHFLFRSQVQ